MWVRTDYRVGRLKRRLLALMICIMAAWDFEQRFLLQKREILKSYFINFFNEVLKEMQFGSYFINFFFKEFIKSNFYILVLKKVLWINHVFLYFYNFYCLYEDWFEFFNYFFNELKFRFAEIVLLLTRYVEWP
jgi:hypothetical protein